MSGLKLKPCWECGAIPVIQYSKGDCYVSAECRGLTGEHCGPGPTTRAKAISMWNTGHGEAPEEWGDEIPNHEG